MDWQQYALELEAKLDQERLKLSNFQKIQEFHHVFGRKPDPTTPEFGDKDYQSLRLNLIHEELKEVMVELGFKYFDDYIWWYKKEQQVPTPIDAAKLAKELADLLYVVYGTAAAFGLPIDEVYDAVHKSNMSKMGDDGKPVRREDGKILKGPNYKEPDIESIIRRHTR